MTWAACTKMILALRDGTEPLAAARAGILQLQEVVAGHTAREQRCYVTQAEARSCWAETAPALAAQLRDEGLAATKPVLIDSLESFTSATSILTDTLALLEAQGEIFSSSGLILLDPNFITSLISPLVDHRLGGDGDPSLVDIPGYCAHLARPQLRLLTTDGRLEASLVPLLWRNVRLREQDYANIFALLEDSGILVRLQQATTDMAARLAGAEHFWVMPMRLPGAPPDLPELWPTTPAGEHLTSVYKFLSDVPPGVMERSVAGCQRLAGLAMLRCWQSGALLARAAGGGPIAKVSVDLDARSVHLEVRAEGAQPGEGGRTLHELQGMLETILGDYPGLVWTAPPAPTDQGHFGTCVGHSLMKVIRSQLHRKYGVDADFHTNIKSLIEKADCLTGALVPEATNSITTGGATIEARDGRLYRIALTVHTSISFDELSRAVRNSAGVHHIVTGTAGHAVVADSVAGPNRVLCLNSWATVPSFALNRNGHANHRFHSFHIISTDIACELVAVQGGESIRERSPPSVKAAWTAQFPGASLAEALLRAA